MGQTVSFKDKSAEITGIEQNYLNFYRPTLEFHMVYDMLAKTVASIEKGHQRLALPPSERMDYCHAVAYLTLPKLEERAEILGSIAGEILAHEAMAYLAVGELVICDQAPAE